MVRLSYPETGSPGQASISLTLPFLLILSRPSGKPQASQPQLACQLNVVLGGRYPCTSCPCQKRPCSNFEKTVPFLQTSHDGIHLSVATGTDPGGLGMILWASSFTSTVEWNEGETRRGPPDIFHLLWEGDWQHLGLSR